MSDVAEPSAALLGTMELSVHVFPPSTEIKIGARLPPAGSGVKAEPAICWGFAGFTEMVGSLSWCDSPLNARGIMFTRRTFVAAFAFFPVFLEVFLAMSGPFATAGGRRRLPDHRFDDGFLLERLKIGGMQRRVHFHFMGRAFRSQCSQFVMFFGFD